MASVDGEHLIRLWDTTTGENTANIEPPGPRASPVWNPNGKMLAFFCKPTTTGDTSLRLVEVPSGKILATLKCDIRPALFPAFSLDGRLLAAGGHDGVKIWSLPKRYAIDKESETMKDK